MKVLVASPIHDKMEYCLNEFIEAIKNISFPHDFLLVDNSKDDNFFFKIKEKIPVIRYSSKESNLKKVVHSRNLILEYAVKNSYDFILMMDSDVIPPKDIIEKLLSHKKDIVSGLYFNEFQSNNEIKLLPVAWFYLTEEEFSELKSKSNISVSRFEIRRHMTLEEAESDKLFEVLYPSAGCMLISRKVFEKIKYGLLDTSIITSDDIYFFDKAREAGFKMFVDTSIKCRHLFKGKFEKDESGNLKNPLYS